MSASGPSCPLVFMRYHILCMINNNSDFLNQAYQDLELDFFSSMPIFGITS